MLRTLQNRTDTTHDHTLITSPDPPTAQAADPLGRTHGRAFFVNVVNNVDRVENVVGTLTWTMNPNLRRPERETMFGSTDDREPLRPPPDEHRQARSPREQRRHVPHR